MTAKMKKILMVFGTRPEAIKMAPLVHKLKAEADSFNVVVCVTAQHREMLDQVLDIFGVVPDIDLNVMKSGQTLFDVTGKVLDAVGNVIRKEAPDLVMVHGDTTTAFAASLAAFYLQVPVAHVEAGLRTNDLQAPFPEEFNRQVVGKLAHFHFAPTQGSATNLVKEGVDPKQITVTGNTVIDALHWALDRISKDEHRVAAVTQELDKCLNFDWQHNPFVLVTGHRRENFGSGFEQICNAISAAAERFPDVHFVYPIHLNPNVRGPAYAVLGDIGNVSLIEPLNYEPFIYLLQNCHYVLTDSGGIQEEAPGLGKPVLVMRDVTERPEAVEAGTVELVGADEKRIFAGLCRLIEDEACYARMARAGNPYGDGKACDRIVNVLKQL